MSNFKVVKDSDLPKKFVKCIDEGSEDIDAGEIYEVAGEIGEFYSLTHSTFLFSKERFIDVTNIIEREKKLKRVLNDESGSEI
jgi:hypothetical protein